MCSGTEILECNISIYFKNKYSTRTNPLLNNPISRARNILFYHWNYCCK